MDGIQRFHCFRSARSRKVGDKGYFTSLKRQNCIFQSRDFGRKSYQSELHFSSKARYLALRALRKSVAEPAFTLIALPNDADIFVGILLESCCETINFIFEERQTIKGNFQAEKKGKKMCAEYGFARYWDFYLLIY